jgi:hypothetical protein
VIAAIATRGADYRSILVGIRVPTTDPSASERFLATLGYPNPKRHTTRRIACFWHSRSGRGLP